MMKQSPKDDPSASPHSQGVPELRFEPASPSGPIPNLQVPGLETKCAVPLHGEHSQARGPAACCLESALLTIHIVFFDGSSLSLAWKHGPTKAASQVAPESLLLFGVLCSACGCYSGPQLHFRTSWWYQKVTQLVQEPGVWNSPWMGSFILM